MVCCGLMHLAADLQWPFSIPPECNDLRRPAWVVIKEIMANKREYTLYGRLDQNV